jgi:hypothetical protein
MANDINNSILETIKMVIENTKFKYDKTFKSRICEVNTNGTYKIVYMNQLYDVPNALGVDLEIGQSVWVKIPCGVFRNMHICGVCKKII